MLLQLQAINLSPTDPEVLKAGASTNNLLIDLLTSPADHKGMKEAMYSTAHTNLQPGMLPIFSGNESDSDMHASLLYS